MTEAPLEPVGAEEILDLWLDVRAHLQAQREHGAVYPIAPLPSRAALAAETVAAPRRSLLSVREALGDCQRCALAGSRTQIVFGAGRVDAPLMLVGQAPHQQDDAQGAPFLGKAGDLLDRILGNVLRLDRADVYLVNIVKCRPPDDRAPERDEVNACAPSLWAQIEAVRPRVIVALGRFAGEVLQGRAAPLHELRGQVSRHRGIPVVVTHHPADLVRDPSGKRETMTDMLLVRATLEQAAGVVLPPVVRGRG